MNRISWVLIELFFIPIILTGQVVPFGSPQITNYTSEEYNAADQNWYIFQDRRGIIYTANSNGILEFDGISWKLIPLSNNLGAWRIVEDSVGKIYVAGSGEIGYLASDKNCNTEYHSLIHLIPEEHRNFRDIWGLYYCNNQIIALAYNKIFIIKDDGTEVICKKSRITELGMFNNKLYVYVDNEGIEYIENSKLHKAVEFSDEKTLFRRLIQWDNTKGLLSGKENGLYIFQDNKISRWKTDLDEYFPTLATYHVTSIGDLYFAIATVKEGIFIIDKKGKIIRHIDNKNGLLSNTIYYLFLDKQNKLWAGHNKGISCIEIFSPFTHFNSQNNITGNIGTSAVFHNRLYLGGEPFLYFIEWPIKDNVQLPQFTNIELMTGQIYNLMVFDDKLFCNHQKGISIIDANNKHYSIRTPEMCWGIVPFGKKEKNILVCTNNEAIILEKINNKWVPKNNVKGHNLFEKAIGFDYNDYLWTYVRNEGIAKLKLNKEFDSIIDKKIFTHIGSAVLDYKAELFIVNQQVFIFVANKIYAYNSFNDDFAMVDFDFDGKILQIISWNEQESLWAKTSEGALHFVKNNGAKFCPDYGEYLNFRYLSKTSQINSSNDSDLFFIHQNGVSYYHPNHSVNQPNKLDASIRKVNLINNDSIIFGGTFPANSEVFVNNQTKAEMVSLDYRNNSVSFSFGTRVPQIDKEIKYQYKLENFDSKWSKWTGETSKDYTNLNAGKYTFVVRAKSPTQGEGLMATYTFEINPPWYYSRTAYLFYIMLLIAIVAFTYFLIIKSLRQKFKKAEKDFKIDLFTNISHEIKTPITLILSPLEEIIAKNEGSEENKSLHMLMYRNAKRLRQLVNLLLDLRKAETGKMELKTKRKDVISFVEDLILPFEHIAKLNKIDYQFCTTYESRDLWFDDQKLEFIITNLLSNAFKYTNVYGKISITVSDGNESSELLILKDFIGATPNLAIGHLKSANFIEIAVEDTGSGITSESTPKIFEKFYHDGKSNLKINNTGIGLAFTERLILLHRGEILVWSKPDYGSKFVVRLATDNDFYKEHEIAEDAGILLEKDAIVEIKKNSEIQSPDNKDEKPSLMLVDDDEDIRVYLRKLFEPDYLIIEASNGLEALKVTKHELPDIIISDIKMPELDGIEFCRRIKNNAFTSHIPIILLTGDNNEKAQFESFESGANQYVAKPFNPNILKVRVKTLLENSKKLKQELRLNFGNDSLICSDDKKKKSLLVKASEVINNNISNPEFNISSLASELNLSRTILYRKFKECTEITPNEFIQVIRLEKSKNLLGQKDLTISEVAYLVGFNDAKYFSTSFKKHFNFTPKEHREKMEERQAEL